MTNKSTIKRKTRQLILSLLMIAASFSVKAQAKGGNNAVSLGIHIPVGAFSSTHFIGIGADYSPANHKFGLLKNKHFALTYNGGVTYYLGKKETVSNYSYEYPSYFFIHAFAGFVYRIGKKVNAILYAGPALGLYSGHAQYNTGSKIELNYSINPKISIGPGILVMKETGSDPLWSASVKATIIF